MAFNGFKLLSCLTLLLILFSTTQGKEDAPKYTKKTSFEFMNMKGYRKGTKSKDIHQLKNYLHKFGYLHLNPTDSKNDVFDDALEASLKTYQTNFHLNPSGILDKKTITTMMMHRCGVADIANGTNFMHAKNKMGSSPNDFHSVAHYSFFTRRQRWPAGQRRLTYGFMSNVPSFVYGPVSRAFGSWASATFFTFAQVPSQNADLVIGWYSGDHGDGAPFEGPGSTLAHAFAPTDGRFHYDAADPWSVQPNPTAFHLESVALHEIGHLLGLGHSTVQAAIMWPSFRRGVTKGLNADDINGINALYA